MIFRGIVFLCLVTVVAEASFAGNLVGVVATAGVKLSAGKLLAVSVPDFDTYLNYSGRIR